MSETADIFVYFKRPKWPQDAPVEAVTVYDIDHAPRRVNVYRVRVPVPADALEPREVADGDVEAANVQKVAGAVAS